MRCPARAAADASCGAWSAAPTMHNIATQSRLYLSSSTLLPIQLMNSFCMLSWLSQHVIACKCGQVAAAALAPCWRGHRAGCFALVPACRGRHRARARPDNHCPFNSVLVTQLAGLAASRSPACGSRVPSKCSPWPDNAVVSIWNGQVKTTGCSKVRPSPLAQPPGFNHRAPRLS